MSRRQRKKIKKWLSKPRTRLGFVVAGLLIIATLASLPLGRLFVARAAEVSAKTYRLEPSQCDGWPDSGRAKKIDLSPNAALPEFSVKNSSSFYNRPSDASDPEVSATSDTTPAVTALDCGKFTAPKNFPGDAKIADARAIFSLGADSYPDNEDVLTLAYSLDGKEWTTLDSFALLEDMSDKTHGGYWSFPLDKLTEPENIKNLQLRAEYHAQPASAAAGVFVDGVALELEAKEKLPAAELPADAVNLRQADLNISESPVVTVRTEEPTALSILGAAPKTRRVISFRLTDPTGREMGVDYTAQEQRQGGVTTKEFTVKTESFTRPGRYTLTMEIEQDGQTREITKDFTWGVLVINTLKSVYRPGETVHFGMGVLNPNGRTICDAKLELTITDPAGKITKLTTADETISYSSACGPTTVTDLPDYAADFVADKLGEYSVSLMATTEEGEHTITDAIQVQGSPDFDITREGPTRIYPVEDYEMVMEVVPAEDYAGSFKEFAPDSFAISDINEDGLAAGLDADGRQIIRWEVDWQAGRAYTLAYTFDAPDISPELYRLGPAKVGNFTEERQWQIASDAACSSTGSTAWNVIGTWSCGHIPLNTDDVTIAAGHAVTIPAAYSAVAGSLAFAGSAASSLTFSASTASLSVTNAGGLTGNVAITSSSGTNALAVAAGTLNVTGTVTITGGASTRIAQLTLTTGTANIGGSITFAGTTANARVVYTSTGTINLKGNLGSGAVAGVFTTVADSIINFNGTSAQTARGYTTYRIFKVNNAAGVTLASSAATIVTLTIGDATGSSVFSDDGNQITCTGTLNLTNGTFKLGGAAATTWPAFTARNINAGTYVEYASAVAQTVSITPTEYKNVTFSGAGQKNVAAGTLAVAGNFSTTSGLAAFNTNNALATVTGNITGTGPITTGTGLITLGGDWVNTGTLTCGSGGVTFSNTGAGTQITGPAGGITFTTLTINKAIANNNNAGTITVSTALNGSNTLTQGTGSTLAINFTGLAGITGLNASSNANTVSYGFAGTQTVYATNYSTLSLATSGEKTLQAGTTTIGVNLNLTGTASTTLAAATLTVSGDISVGTGTTLALASKNVALAGHLTTTTTGTVTCAGCSAGTFAMSGASKNLGGGAGAITFYNLTVSGSETLQSGITVSNNLSIGAGNSLELNGQSTSLAGDLVTNVTGSVTCASCVAGTFTMTGASKTIGSGGATAITFYNLTTSGSETLGAAIVVAGDMNISAGSLNTSGSNYQITFKGGFANSGAFTANASPIVIAGTSTAPNIAGFTTTGALSFTRTASTATFTGDVTAASLTLNGTGGTLALGTGRSHTINGAVLLTNGTLNGGTSTITVKGNWTNNATFTANAGTVNIGGNTAQTLSGTLTGASGAFYDLTLTNSSGSVSGCATSFTAGVVFGVSATATNNYTILTTGLSAGVYVQYLSTGTYTFTNINWVGTGAKTIYFRNSDLGAGTWALNVTTTQTAVTYVDVARSNAGGYPQIVANDGTNTNCGSNTNWLFTSAPTFTQNYYRFYVDNDANLPTDPWPVGGTDLLQNTAITTSDSPPDDDGLVRIRTSVQVGGGALTADSQAFKLQYAERSDGACASVSSWTAVGAAGSAEIWRGESDSTPADGAMLTSHVLDPSDINESYEEQNNSVNNPNAIAVGEDGEWDWLIQNNGARHDTTYCFRMVKSDDTGFATYTNYPKISTEVTTFSSSFEGGNGANFTKPYASDSGKASYNSELDGGTSDPECTASATQNWFYFSMNNALNQTIDFTLIDAIGANSQWPTAGQWTNTKPVYSYDQITWYRVSAAGTISGNNFLYTAPGGGAKFTQDTVYIAYNIPYTYTNLQSDLATWDVPAYVTVTDIGDSIQLREMDLITIDDDTYVDDDAVKKVYWIIARQHPAEVTDDYQIKGVIDFLIGNSDEAKIMRRASIFKIIPMMNPDGAYQGWTRTNAHLCDTNREWEDTGASASLETDEVYNAHYAIDNWMTNGTPADAETFADYHGQASATAEGEVYDGDSTMDGNVESPYETLFDTLDSNTHTREFGASSTAGLFNVEIYDQYNASKGSVSFTLEGPNTMFSATEYPTKQNMQAYGLAFAKALFAQHEAYSKVFALATTDAGSPADPDYFVVGSPSQYFAFFDEDNGGGIDIWYDRENDPNCTQPLVDTTKRPLDEVAWVDTGATTWNTYQTSNAALTVTSNTGTRVRFKYDAEWENVANMNYTWERTIWEDGRFWSTFAFTNNTGSSIDWTYMNHQISLNYTYTANFNFAYDNTDITPTPGTDNWWGSLGTGAAGKKSSAIALYVGQSGGWTYDSYTSTDDATGKRNSYRTANGPVQTNGTTITTYLDNQIRPDTDDMANETAVDYYRNDIANPDSPTMTTGTFTEFDKQEGGLEFAASSNNVKFTYTNATTYTKKKPVYLFTNYTASTAPVLKVNDAYLDSETGAAHPSDTYIGTQYTSWVDDANNTAYVQYLSDISTNINVEIKDVFGITVDGKAYSDDNETTPLNGASVCVAVNGTEGSCDATNASGEFTITSVNAGAGGEQLTFYIDGGSTFGNTVTTGDGSSIVTGDNLRVYQNHVVVRYETGSSLAITGMDAYDNDQNPTDMLFDAEDSSPDTLSVEGTNELFVQAGYTFAPGGNVTTSHDIEIDGTWTAASGETVALSGTYKLDTGGTLNPSTSTITFNATSGTEDLITTGTGSLYGLTLDDSAGSLVVEVEDPLDINGTLTITGGTLDVVNGESNQINIAGNWANSDIFEAQSGTVVADGTAQQTFSGNLTGASAFNNLTITNYFGTDPDTSPSVIFSASASTDATFTATTADTKLRFLASGTYTFQNVSFNGQADTTRVALRSSTGGTDWNLNIAGTRSVLNTNVKDSDACGQAPDIDGTHPSNYNATGNTCWGFYSLTFDASDNTVGFGSLTAANVRFATGDLSGSAAKVSGHNLQATTTYTGGYTIKYLGATLTSGGDTITAATIVDDDDGAFGGEQFALGVITDGDATITTGYNATSPADYKYVPSVLTTIISEAGATALETISVYYLGNIAALTEAGTYATDITYTMTATF